MNRASRWLSVAAWGLLMFSSCSPNGRCDHLKVGGDATRLKGATPTTRPAYGRALAGDCTLDGGWLRVPADGADVYPDCLAPDYACYVRTEADDPGKVACVWNWCGN